MSSNVIVIGAGAAGLMAASVLAENKYRVTVVEARDRTGGRIHTQIPSSFSFPVETGAEFIHGHQSLTHALARQSKAGLSRVLGKWYQFRNGAVQRHNFFDKDWEHFNRRLAELKTDMDMGSFINTHFAELKYRQLRQKITAFVQGYDAADMNEVSALSLKDEWAETDDAHQYRIKGGYATLIRHLEKELRKNGGIVLTSSPVEEIQWSRGQVRVAIRGGRIIDGDKVIITLPVGVLQKGPVKFSPSLTGHEKAFHNIGFGGVIKFFFRFDTSFWQRPGHHLKDAAFVISDAEIPTWWTQFPDDSPVLTGWFGGPETFNVDHNAAVLYEKAAHSLAYIFNMPVDGIKAHVRDWFIADWVADPFARGAYAFAKVATPAARELLTRPVDDTLYFAGEALYAGPAMGTVEAALVSGKEVVMRI